MALCPGAGPGPMSTSWERGGWFLPDGSTPHPTSAPRGTRWELLCQFPTHPGCLRSVLIFGVSFFSLGRIKYVYLTPLRSCSNTKWNSSCNLFLCASASNRYLLSWASPVHFPHAGCRANQVGFQVGLPTYSVQPFDFTGSFAKTITECLLCSMHVTRLSQQLRPRRTDS